MLMYNPMMLQNGQLPIDLNGNLNNADKLARYKQNLAQRHAQTMHIRNTIGRSVVGDSVDFLKSSEEMSRNQHLNRLMMLQSGGGLPIMGGFGNNNQIAMLFKMFLAMMQGQNPQALQALGQQPQQVQAKKNIRETKDSQNEFTTMDSDGNGEVSMDEFLTHYIRSAERSLGKQIKKDSPDWLKYEAEAKNIFGTLKERTFLHPLEGRIKKARFEQYLKYLDRADGKLDGKYDADYAAGVLGRIKETGADTEISAGKTLPSLIDMEG